MPQTSMQKLYEYSRRAREQIRSTREKEKVKTNALILRAGTTGSTFAGILIAAAIDGKWGHDSETEKHGIAAIGPVPVNAIIGIAGLAVGLPGMLPGSEYIATLGAATLAYPLAKTLEDKIASK